MCLYKKSAQTELLGRWGRTSDFNYESGVIGCYYLVSVVLSIFFVTGFLLYAITTDLLNASAGMMS